MSFIYLIILIFVLFFIVKLGKNPYKNGYKKPFKKYYYKKYNKYKRYNKKIKKSITEQRLSNMDTGNIKVKKIMNIEETKIFYSILKIFKDYNIYKQVSFKAFLDTEEDTDVWKTFRDFYCDFLITYKKGDRINEPIAIIEYDGAGHFGNTEDMKERIKNNDTVKEKLINKAGMQYFIIEENNIKIDSKFIDDKKLESCLFNIMDSIKNND
ncbi:DUF2726 domain-containing protein [uncultured Brachyspira sp.]|uniref:DUF2726 domain-containing protein n=5 Tax=uncultured Brachyspira sp. TaxID=221953 RepID=UPI0025DB5B74|nr:DUF2726 domain-containing protein [uncultured Brachyspira sp.]